MKIWNCGTALFNIMMKSLNREETSIPLHKEQPDDASDLVNVFETISALIN